MTTALLDPLLDTTRPSRKRTLNWHVAMLGDVVDILDSRRIPVNAEEREKRRGPVPYYGATGQVGWIDDYIFDEELVLLGEDGAPFLDHTKPKAYMIRGKAWVNNHAHVLRGEDGVLLNSFLLHQLNRVEYGPYVSGTTRLKLPQAAMRRIPLCIPPLDEQQRIVAEIEKQFTRLDAGVASLKQVQTALKRYRGSVLKAACEGRLVPTEAELARKENRSLPAPRPGTFYVYAIRCDNDSLYIGQTENLQRRWHDHLTTQACDWTRQHRAVYVAHYEEYSSRDAAVEREKWLKTGFGRKWLKREIAAGRARQAGYETGEQLLQHILKERREKWNGKGKYKEPTASDIASLPVIPEGWTWATAEQLGYVQLGRQRSPKNRSNKYPTKYLRAANITEEGIDLSDVLDMEFTPIERAQYQLRAGDLILSEASGSPDQVGKPAVCRKEHAEYCFQNTVIRQRPAASLSRYLLVVYRHYYFNKIFARLAGGVGINHLSAAKFSKIPIPLPPLPEQNRIVTEVERRLSVIAEVTTLITVNFQRAVCLRQSILHLSFSAPH